MSDPYGILGNYRKGGGIMLVDDLIIKVYEDNYSHLDFIENMNGGDCDCNLHSFFEIIKEYTC